MPHDETAVDLPEFQALFAAINAAVTSQPRAISTSVHCFKDALASAGFVVARAVGDDGLREAVAGAIWASDNPDGPTWAEWLAYIAARPMFGKDVGDCRRRADAILPLIHAREATLRSDLAACQKQLAEARGATLAEAIAQVDAIAKRPLLLRRERDMVSIVADELRAALRASERDGGEHEG